jgi:hypothetical protein
VKRRKWRIPLLRKRRSCLQSSCVISLQVSGKTLLPILALGPSRTSKKDGNGKTESGGQVSHTESLAESGNGANTLVGAPSAGEGISQRQFINEV